MSDFSYLLKRIDTLERHRRALAWENRTLKGAGAAAAVAVLSLLLLGHGQPGRAEQKKERVVEAEKFLLRDGSNRVRAAIFVSASGPKYDLYDEKGTLRATLALDARGEPTLVFFGADRKPQVTLAAGPTRQALTFHGSRGEVRTMLSRDGDGGLLGFLDAKGKVRTALTDGASGSGLLLSDSQGKVRLSALVEKDQPALRLLDGAGKALFSRP